MKFQDDISNMNTYVRTYIHTYIRTSRNQYAPPPLFQSWGHNKKKKLTEPGLEPTTSGLEIHKAKHYYIVITKYQRTNGPSGFREDV